MGLYVGTQQGVEWSQLIKPIKANAALNSLAVGIILRCRNVILIEDSGGPGRSRRDLFGKDAH